MIADADLKACPLCHGHVDYFTSEEVGCSDCRVFAERRAWQAIPRHARMVTCLDTLLTRLEGAAVEYAAYMCPGSHRDLEDAREALRHEMAEGIRDGMMNAILKMETAQLRGLVEKYARDHCEHTR